MNPSKIDAIDDVPLHRANEVTDVEVLPDFVDNNYADVADDIGAYPPASRDGEEGDLIPYPRYACTDNCCNDRKNIQRVFPHCVVIQDSKHLINRFLEKTSKQSSLYLNFALEIHRCLTEKSRFVLSRDGKTTKEIAGPLLAGDVMWSSLKKIVQQYKEQDKEKVTRNETSLFLANFDRVFENQEYCVKNCVKDPIIDGKYYTEMENGNFVLLRGTNRNGHPSHSRVSGLYLCKCSRG